jgi:hypothetical protein
MSHHVQGGDKDGDAGFIRSSSGLPGNTGQGSEDVQGRPGHRSAISYQLLAQEPQNNSVAFEDGVLDEEERVGGVSCFETAFPRPILTIVLLPPIILPLFLLLPSKSSSTT